MTRALTDVGLSDEACLATVVRIRAISWRWRLGATVRVPRLLLGVGRRHYGVAAQDVDRELGARLPSIVGCTKGRRCPRHGRGLAAAGCAGRLMVDYRLLAEVVARAAVAIDGAGTARPAAAGGIRPERLSRRCHDLIAAIQLAAAGQDGRG